MEFKTYRKPSLLQNVSLDFSPILAQNLHSQIYSKIYKSLNFAAGLKATSIVDFVSRVVQILTLPQIDSAPFHGLCVVLQVSLILLNGAELQYQLMER